MTVEQWAQQQTGLVLKVPAGTRTGRILHYYQLSTGEWVLDPKEHGETWTPEMPRRLEHEATKADQYVELQVNAGTLAQQALKALKNRSGVSWDGALAMKRRRK